MIHHIRHTLITIACLAVCAIDTGLATDKKILILSSYGFDYHWSNSIIDSISLEVEDKLPEMEINVEYISSERFPDPTAWVERINLLLSNYVDNKPEAIVIISDEAWMAYQDAKTDIFKGIPLFLCAVKPHSIPLQKLVTKLDSLTLKDFRPTTEVMKQYGATGVIRQMNVPMYIKLMNDLIPDIDSYTIITDKRFYGIYNHLLIHEYLKEHSALPVQYIDARLNNTVSLLTKLPKISPNSGVLLTSWLTGEAGFEYSKTYTYRKMAAVLKTPVFITNDIGLNTGYFLGGYFTKSKYWGNKVSQMIVQALNGTPLDSIPAQTFKDEECWINWNVLNKFQIPESALPNSTYYINHPTPIYKKYANELAIAAIVLFMLLISFVYILQSNIKLKRAQKSTLQAISETDHANEHLIRTQENLKQALHKAEAADRMKSAFISNMDHEIRTPLNSIVGFSSLITTMSDKEDIEEAARQIADNSDKLLAIIKGILDLAQMESEDSTLDINYEMVNPYGLIQDLVNQCNLVVKPGVTIVCQPSEVSLSITTDRQLLTKALSCLLNNAVKFTMKGTIEIGYQRVDAQWVKFHVKDTGIGIKECDIKRIFERFYKYDSYISGSGLGLSIAKRVIELLGGTIGVESTPEAGSTFWFSIKINNYNES